MMAQVFIDKAGDEVVAVVITWLQAQLKGVTRSLRRLDQYLGLELVFEEIVAIPLIHQ
ncbi:hypothetical protein D3C75_1070090 [compost metagenome]